MSLFGKILAFFNVLAAIGFVCMAATVYAKHRAWAHAVFMDELLINGLPLDASQVDPEGRNLAERIGEETQRKLFERSGSPSVNTQEDEVKRVQSRVNSLVSSAGDTKQQLAQLARVLLPFAQTNAGRERLHALRTWLGNPRNLEQHVTGAANDAAQKFRQAPPPGRPKPNFAELFHDALNARGGEPIGPLEPAFVRAFTAGAQKTPEVALNEALEELRAELAGELQAQFAEVLNNQRRTANKGRGLGLSERRQAIARLLFNLVDAVPEGQAAAPNQPESFADTPRLRRLVTVVGLRELAGAVQARATDLARITVELTGERSRDMSRFAKDHMARLDEVRQQAKAVADHNAELLRKQGQLTAQNELVKKRQAEVDSYRSELADSRRETASRLRELRTMSQALFEERVKLRDATRENQKLEKDLHKLEEGR